MRRPTPDSPTLTPDALAAARIAESNQATALLGVGEPLRLGIPDGGVSAHEHELTTRLVGVLTATPGEAERVWVLATWRGDGHPDHEATGRAAAEACSITGHRLIEYPVWMWHWARPADPAVPWNRIRVLTPGRGDPGTQTPCRRRIPHPDSPAFRRPAGRRDPPAVGARETDADDGMGAVVSAMDPGYFETMYAESADPWGFDERWYERRKYALTLAALPPPALSAGVRTGVLDRRAHGAPGATLRLGRRNRRGTACAGERTGPSASRRTGRPGGTRPGIAARPWPPGAFDLVVLSEVLYYLTPADLTTTLGRAVDASKRVAPSWRSTGSIRYRSIRRPGARCTRRSRRPTASTVPGAYRDADFHLDVYTRGPVPSVAAAEGLS